MTAWANFVPVRRAPLTQYDFLQLIRKLAPDLSEEMARRAMMLDRINALQPVGRRQLAQRLNLPEREIRNTAALLKDLGYIELGVSGMTLTEHANEILDSAREFSKAISGLTDKERQLESLLKVDHVLIVTGNAETDVQVLQDMGRAAAARLKAILQNGDTLAVSGGGTIAAVAHNLAPNATPLNVMVVPARGGLGRSIELQANTLASEIAVRLGGHHRLIHLPDHLDNTALQEMMKLPEIREALELLERADVILHGIGIAEESMKNRKLPVRIQKELTAKRVAGESFGNYFDPEGNCLLESSAIGIDLARLSPKCRMIAVAGGKSKAEAIIAVLRHYHHALLVVDEGAADRMLSDLQS